MVNDVMYYDPKLGKLSTSVLSKARKFNRLGLVEEITEMSDIMKKQRIYVVKRIEGYNNTDYEIIYNRVFRSYSCNCQSNRINGRECSHIQAVKLFVYNGGKE